MTARNWCFTNFDLKVTENLHEWDKVKYLIYQEEECPDTGKHHHQGYLQLKSACRLAALKKFLPKAHWEVARGTPEENINYCSKTDTQHSKPITIGEPSMGQGQRTDLAGIVRDITAGRRIIDIIEESPATLRLIGYMERLSALAQKPRNTMPEVIIISGRPGCGKSTFVLDEVAKGKVEDVYRIDPTSVNMWEGYRQERVICFEDMGPDTKLTPTMLLRICDRWPMKVNVKYAHAELNSPVICFTSNYKWEDWMGWGASAAAFQRRITSIINM